MGGGCYVSDGTHKSLRFGVQIVWREPKNRFNQCYFCLSNLKGFSRHTKKTWNYPDLESDCRPVPHCEEVAIPEFNDLPGVFTEYNEFHQDIEGSACDSIGSMFESSSLIPEQFKQEELSDLIRDFNLSKEAAESLASWLKDKNYLKTRISINSTVREKKNYICILEEELVYCKNIEGLLLKMGVSQYSAQEWRLFTDSSKEV